MTDSRNFRLHGGKRGAALAVRLAARAPRNEIAEILSDGTVQVRLTASPADEKANSVLIEFLAEVLQVPKAKIEILAGSNGQDKLVSVLDLDSETVQKRIIAHLP